MHNFIQMRLQYSDSNKKNISKLFNFLIFIKNMYQSISFSLYLSLSLPVNKQKCFVTSYPIAGVILLEVVPPHEPVRGRPQVGHEVEVGGDGRDLRNLHPGVGETFGKRIIKGQILAGSAATPKDRIWHSKIQDETSKYRMVICSDL